MGKRSRKGRIQESTCQYDTTAVKEGQPDDPKHSYASLGNSPNFSANNPPSDNSVLDPEDINNTISKEKLAYLCREGGAPLYNYLINFAYSTESSASPNLTNVHEWHFKDITYIKDPKVRKDFKQACKEELEALWHRGTFEKVDRHSIKKLAIRCHWIFDVKSDGCKKACLVAKGFSQHTGIDYNDIYSSVVRFETVRLMLELAALKNWHIIGLDV